MEIVSEIEQSAWTDFLMSQRGFSLFQAPPMFRVFKQTAGYGPRLLAVQDRGEIRALVVSCLIAYARKVLPPLATRAVVVGGPIGDPRLFSALLAAHDRWAKRGAMMCQVRNLRTDFPPGPMIEAGYQWVDHINYILDLRRGKDRMFSGLSRTRRKSIVKGDTSGLRYVELTSTDADRVYRLLSQTYRRIHVPLADVSLFKNAFELLSGQKHLLARGAEADGSLCAVRLVLRWESTLLDWYAGSSSAGREVRADEWLVWQVLLEGKTMGCNTYDFGGAGRPNEAYGPGEFKRQFGGQRVNPGRFEKVYHRLALNAIKTSYNVWRRFR